MLIPFPAFESNLHYLVDSARELESGRAASAETLLAGLHDQLERIRGSSRHDTLRGFVKHAVRACERGDPEAALRIISVALCHFAPEQAHSETSAVSAAVPAISLR
jgi:hypothetical protein